MKTNILARAPEAQVGIVPIRTFPNSEEDRLVLARLGRVVDRGRVAREPPAVLGFEPTGKLYRARSRLYRSQILQENMRLKALAEIYTMHSFAQLCNLIFFVKICQNFCKFCKILQN